MQTFAIVLSSNEDFQNQSKACGHREKNMDLGSTQETALSVLYGKGKGPGRQVPGLTDCEDGGTTDQNETSQEAGFQRGGQR